MIYLTESKNIATVNNVLNRLDNDNLKIQEGEELLTLLFEFYTESENSNINSIT
jgi:hypothetical protein